MQRLLVRGTWFIRGVRVIVRRGRSLECATRKRWVPEAVSDDGCGLQKGCLRNIKERPRYTDEAAQAHFAAERLLDQTIEFTFSASDPNVIYDAFACARRLDAL